MRLKDNGNNSVNTTPKSILPLLSYCRHISTFFMAKKRSPKYIREELDLKKPLNASDIFNKAKWGESVTRTEAEYIRNVILSASLSPPYDAEIDNAISAYILLYSPNAVNVQLLEKFMDDNIAFGMYKECVVSAITCWPLWRDSEMVVKWLESFGIVHT